MEVGGGSVRRNLSSFCSRRLRAMENEEIHPLQISIPNSSSTIWINSGLKPKSGLMESAASWRKIEAVERKQRNRERRKLKGIKTMRTRLKPWKG
ncbi:hypothetical protein ACFX1Q_034576 [Malus domestica]